MSRRRQKWRRLVAQTRADISRSILAQFLDHHPALRKLIVPTTVSLIVHSLILVLIIGAAIRAGGFATAFGRVQMTPGEIAIEFTAPLSLNEPAKQSAPNPARSSLMAPSPAPLTDEFPTVDMPQNPAAASVVQAFKRGPAWPTSASILSTTDAAITAPEVSFAGLGMPRAASVVYVVDASGPMVTSLPMVLAELRRSVNALAPVQRLQVIIYRDRGNDTAQYQVFDTRGKGLVKASTRTKRALDQWLDEIRPAGKSSPLPGLAAALKLKPDVIFLLARSIQRSGGAWGQGRDQILAKLDRLNPPNDDGQRQVVIKTIQFLDEDPSGVMQAIGQIHGQGSYTVLRLEDLTR